MYNSTQWIDILMTDEVMDFVNEIGSDFMEGDMSKTIALISTYSCGNSPCDCSKKFRA